MVQTNELQRTKKKQTYLRTSYISRKRRLSEKTFFTDKEKFQVFRKVAILAIPRLKKTE